MTTIAHKYGYSSSSHFSAEVKSRLGKTPRELCKSYENKITHYYYINFSLMHFNGLLTLVHMPQQRMDTQQIKKIYVVFETVSSYAGKPTIVSKLAMKKQISGNFDLTEPYALIERLSAQMGLIWYDDG